jgi:hypothetical protein
MAKETEIKVGKIYRIKGMVHFLPHAHVVIYDVSSKHQQSHMQMFVT